MSRGEGSGEGVDASLLSGTLYSIGLTESATWARVRLRKKPMNLCACVSEQREHGEGAGVLATADLQTLVCMIQAHVVESGSS